MNLIQQSYMLPKCTFFFRMSLDMKFLKMLPEIYNFLMQRFHSFSLSSVKENTPQNLTTIHYGKPKIQL